MKGPPGEYESNDKANRDTNWKKAYCEQYGIQNRVKCYSVALSWMIEASVEILLCVTNVEHFFCHWICIESWLCSQKYFTQLFTLKIFNFFQCTHYQKHARKNLHKSTHSFNKLNSKNAQTKTLTSRFVLKVCNCFFFGIRSVFTFFVRFSHATNDINSFSQKSCGSGNKQIHTYW